MKYSDLYPNEPKEVVDNFHARSEKQYYELVRKNEEEK